MLCCIFNLPSTQLKYYLLHISVFLLLSGDVYTVLAWLLLPSIGQSLHWIFVVMQAFLRSHIYLSIYISIYLSIYSCCSHLEHRTAVKRFVSLQFLNLRQSVGLLGRGISPTQGRYLHRTTQTQNKRRQTSLLWVGFEPTIPAFEQEKTFHALDRVVMWSARWHIHVLVKVSNNVSHNVIQLFWSPVIVKDSTFSFLEID
jgi:hypothetical protein